MSGEPDLGEAVDYILAERPRLSEDDVWAVLVELGRPPERDESAVDRLRRARPEIRPRDVRMILREWRAYEGLALEADWDE